MAASDPADADARPREAPAPAPAAEPVGGPAAQAARQPPSAAEGGGAQQPDSPGQETGKDEAGVGDEYAERGRAEVTRVYIYDNRTYGVYAEGTINAREIAGRDRNSAAGAKSGAGQAARTVSVVAVASQDRKRLRKVAVGAGQRGRAAEVLERHRLVILHGPAGGGKGTAGLWLLGFDHEVLSVDPSLTARDLGDFSRRLPYGEQRRYLVEAMPPATAAQLSGFVLRAAARDLEADDSYLVITVDDRIPLDPELAGYVVAWPDRPDSALALRTHLEYYLGDTDAAAVAGCYDLPRLGEALAGRALRSVDEVARVVADAFRASRPFDSLLDDLGFGAAPRVADWFAAGERSPADLGFLLAVTVLGGCPYSTVAWHARRLEQLIAEASRIKLSKRPGNPLRSRSQRVRDAMAVLEPGFVETEYGQSPAEMARLENRWLVQAVLSTVWHEYDMLAEALLRWLLEAGDDPDPGVRLRAAAAAGWLSQYEFAALRQRLFLPWARGSSGEAWAAADALGQAAWLDSTAPLVLALLSVWALLDDYDLWWTAAVAYGGEVGVRYPGVAMDHLLAITDKADRADRSDPRAPRAVAHSLVRLVASGGRFAPEIAAFVLAHLASWLKHGQSAALTAQAAYAEMLRRASDVDWPSSREYWQLLVAPASLDVSARLLRGVMQEKTFRSGALESIETLTRACDHDKAIQDDLAALLGRVASGGANDRGRLAHYLNRWAAGSDPSAAARDLANQLMEVTPV